MRESQKYKNIPHGDMPGDRIEINENHVKKAEQIYSKLKELLNPILDRGEKAVVAVCGGSGVGKSEIGSLLAYMLNEDGIGSYVMSGDNYPHRIPAVNDAKREEIYNNGGKEALAAYLGSQEEIDFELVDRIVNSFKQGDAALEMKRMGRTESERWFSNVDMSETKVLIIEWTHSNSVHFHGVDIPILLNSTPEETLEHRRSRNRDGAVDSPFTMMVLELEQEMLKKQAYKAKIIVSKLGELLSYEDYCKLMKIDE